MNLCKQMLLPDWKQGIGVQTGLRPVQGLIQRSVLIAVIPGLTRNPGG